MPRNELQESSVLREIASLHARSLRDNGLSRCGTGFITCYYEAAAAHPSTILLTEMTDDDKLAGFILCSTDCRHLFSRVMRTTGFRAVRYPRGIVFALARALVSWLRGSPPVRYDVEVVFVAVEQNRLRSGVGRALLAKALEELRQRGKRGVFLRVAENNVAAIGFYESAGFEPVINWRGKRIMRREIKA